ncbi:ABC-type transport system involved in Fe-S cluster assembly, permease component [Actinobacteria bacterium IMCC26207]|nr:ABC-type transport system involved in Fe-S cluster assembly, permease component [Actinobacteria bacterium IMCC26207]
MSTDLSTDSFSSAVADSLDGPAWLRERRHAAAEDAAQMAFPSTDSEEWRYSRIGDLDLEKFAMIPARDADAARTTDEIPLAVSDFMQELGPLGGSVLVYNGRIISTQLSDELRQQGVVFGAVPEEATAEGAASALGAVMHEAPDLFGAYNDAFGADPVVLDVPRNLVIDLPLAVVFYVDVADSITFPRLSVRGGENSQFSFIEASLSADVPAVVAPVTEVVVGSAARVSHSALQDVGPQVWQVGTFLAEVGQAATLDAALAAIGGSYARLRMDCRLVGRGASGNLSSAYFGDDHQMLDLRTFQEHQAADTTSKLLFKGAVADNSHSVYTGLIRIKPDARGSNAYQTNRNLKLSDTAWAESVPNLEIENNDVHCSHASTVGPVDEEQRFYVESRGVPSLVAERLIVAGFFDEVLDHFAVPALASAARDRVNKILDSHVGALLTSDSALLAEASNESA